MAGLIFDERALADGQMKQYNKFLHSRLNKYIGDGRTLVTYFNIDSSKTTMSLGTDTNYGILGKDSAYRFNVIHDMFFVNMSEFASEEKNASSTTVRDTTVSGEAIIIPGTIMPKENDMFIINHYQMTHIMRVNNVVPDALNSDGSYRIQYDLYSTNPTDIEWLKEQTTGEYKLDMKTIGGEDLTPVISMNDYEKRSRLIAMINDMIDNYKANFYSERHNCYLCRLGCQTLFDPCANKFMSDNSVMIIDGGFNNTILNPNKLRSFDMLRIYELSPYKWMERHAPERFVDTFKYRTAKAFKFKDSTFFKYADDVDIIVFGDDWCGSKTCEYYFPIEIERVLANKYDIRQCETSDCQLCEHNQTCQREFKLKRYDYVSIIHDYIHGQMTNIDKLSLLTGDQLFNNFMTKELYLWTPIIVYILKQTLKIK